MSMEGKKKKEEKMCVNRIEFKRLLEWSTSRSLTIILCLLNLKRCIHICLLTPTEQRLLFLYFIVLINDPSYIWFTADKVKVPARANSYFSPLPLGL